MSPFVAEPALLAPPRCRRRIRCRIPVHLFRLSRPAMAISDAIREHDNLVAAVTGGDPAAAEDAMLRHILGSRHRFGEESPQA